MKQEQINKLLNQREKLLKRRDGLYDHALVARIDARLSTVPEGHDNEVDLALGRKCAQLPNPAAQVWSTDADRAAWLQEGIENGKRLAEAMKVDYANWQDQTRDHDEFNGVTEAAAIIEETPKDWRDMRGDLEI